MRVIAPRQHWEGFDPPDPEGDEMMRRMLSTAAKRRCAHMNMRMRKRDGTVVEPAHIPEKCPECKVESLEIWDRKKWALDREARAILEGGGAQFDRRSGCMVSAGEAPAEVPSTDDNMAMMLMLILLSE